MITRADINKDQDFLVKISIRMVYFLILCFVNIFLVINFRNNLQWIDFLNSEGWDFLGIVIYHALYPLTALTILTAGLTYWAVIRMKKNRELLKMQPMDLLSYQAEKIK